jgi:peptidoglycan/LPS O-acetylase OafA/YrhL
MIGFASRQSHGDDFISSSYFPSLDGLRTLSVFFVMANHLPMPVPLQHVVFGWVGVQVFFVISGFLITTLLLREEARHGRISLSAFYLRRVFRILPVYYAVLGLYVAICLLAVSGEKWRQLEHGLPYYVLFVQEYSPQSAGTVFGHSWSLGVEEKFYLLWPFVFFVALRRWRLRWLVVCSVLLGLALLGHGVPLCRAYFAIAVGCALAIAMNSQFALPTLRRFASTPPLVPLGLIIAAYCLLNLSPVFVLGFHWATAYLLLHLLLNDSWLRRVMTLRSMVWMGRRSYSMYLLHVLCLNVVEREIPSGNVPQFFAVLLLAFGLTAIVSHFSYTLIEQPAIKIGKGIVGRRAANLKERTLRMT